MKKLLLSLLCFLWAQPGLALLFAQTVEETGNRGTILGPDDSITIVALDCEEISKEWRISSTGEVNLPMIGSVRLAGLSIEQAQDAIAAKLRRYLKQPQVTIYASETRSRPVTVAGAVEHPGKFQITRTTTLFDAIVLAGGPKNAGQVVTVK